MEDKGKNAEAAAAGEESEDLGATGAMGATGAAEESTGGENRPVDSAPVEALNGKRMERE